MQNFKFAVAGFGHIGRRHATIINEYPTSTVVAIIDSNPEVQNHELFPKGTPFFTSFEDFAASGIQADVLNVCTPNGLHADYALKGLAHHLHVVIEKPMALSKADCEEILYKSLQVSRHVFVVKQNRYSPPSKWLKSVVEDGTLGNIYMVQINCYWNRDNRYYKAGGWKGSQNLDGGTLYTQFSHFIDIMYWVFGDIKNIHASMTDFNHQDSTEFEDSGLVQFEFVRGGMGCLNFSTSVWDTNLESSITVIGEKGSVKIGGQYMNEVEVCHIENYNMPELPPTNPPNDYGPFKGSAANHHYIIENVVNTLNGHETMTTNALEGLKVVDIIERIYKAAHK